MAEYFFNQPTDEEVKTYWSQVVKPKESIFELNFKEKAVTIGSILEGGKMTFIDEKAWEDVILPAISADWHDPGKDEIEHLLLYNDKKYLCQRRKLRFDFATETTSWKTYLYKDGPVADVERIRDIVETVVVIQKRCWC